MYGTGYVCVVKGVVGVVSPLNQCYLLRHHWSVSESCERRLYSHVSAVGYRTFKPVYLLSGVDGTVIGSLVVVTGFSGDVRRIRR